MRSRHPSPANLDRSEAFFRDIHAIGRDVLNPIGTVSRRSATGALAFDGMTYRDAGGMPWFDIAILAAPGTDLVRLGGDGFSCMSPAWSPDGKQLAFLSDKGRSRGDFQIRIAPADCPARDVPGPVLDGQVVETLAWSPCGKRLLLRTAALPSAIREGPAWMPSVSTDRPDGWRQAWIWACGTESLVRAGQDGLSVWEAAWCGDDAVVALASDDPTHGGWYGARLFTAAASGGNLSVLHGTDKQMGHPACSPDGRYVAFLSGYFHRSLEIGDIAIYDRAEHRLLDLPTLGVDASYIEWRNDHALFFTGLQSLETVSGTIEVGARRPRIEWRTTWTTGDWTPRAWPTGKSGSIGAVHGHDRPPRLTLWNDDGEAIDLFRFECEEHARAVALYGGLTPLRWKGRDGLELEGLIATPPGEGPSPLVTFLHGGPVHGFRNAWALGFAFLPLFVAAGYALFLPNPRGGSGRGQAFARMALGDIGGEDLHDILRGVDHVVVSGLADPRRLVVSGGSYGGFLASHAIARTDRFAAAVIMCPLTHIRSQYFTAHHPELMTLLTGGDPFEIGGRFEQCSPLLSADRVRTPALIIAGGLDTATPPGQAIELHQALKRRGVATTLVVYPLEGHGIVQYEAQVDQGARILDWLEEHVPSALA